MRRRKKPGSEETLLTLVPPLVIQPEQYKGIWQQYFGNNQPIQLELGMGKGRFITTLAKNNPHINYIGLEIKEEVLLTGVRKAVDEQLPNIAFIWGNVQNLEQYFANGELTRIYINFCDPWPKNRWANRRLTYRGFLASYREILCPDGQVFFKTDNEPLFEFSLNEFSQAGWILQDISFDLYASPPTDNVATEYEQKFVEQGMKIYYLGADKNAL